MGVCLWSPPLDIWQQRSRCGVRKASRTAVQLSQLRQHQAHPGETRPTDSTCRAAGTESRQSTVWCLYNGDLTALRLMALANHDMTACDYDGRTALHLAAPEGHLECVKFVVEKCCVDVAATDRWSHTPLDDAVRFHRNNVQHYLENLDSKHLLEKCDIEESASQYRQYNVGLLLINNSILAP